MFYVALQGRRSTIIRRDRGRQASVAVDGDHPDVVDCSLRTVARFHHLDSASLACIVLAAHHVVRVCIHAVVKLSVHAACLECAGVYAGPDYLL